MNTRGSTMASSSFGSMIQKERPSAPHEIIALVSGLVTMSKSLRTKGAARAGWLLALRSPRARFDLEPPLTTYLSAPPVEESGAAPSERFLWAESLSSPSAEEPFSVSVWWLVNKLALQADRCWNAASFGRWLSPLAPDVRWLSPLLSPALRPGNAGAAAGAPPVGWYPANDPGGGAAAAGKRGVAAMGCGAAEASWSSMTKPLMVHWKKEGRPAASSSGTAAMLVRHGLPVLP